MKIGIVGVGNMGSAFAKALIAKDKVSQERLYLFDTNEEKLKELKAEHIGVTQFGITKELQECDTILLAVKPQSFVEIAEHIRPFLEEKQLFISIMAGIKTTLIQELLGTDRVVRAMPNTPCQIGKGVTGYYLHEGLSEGVATTIQLILESTGQVVRVEKEEDIDSVTALSGSGPAYFYYFLKHLVQAGMDLGLEEEKARQLALSTMEGAFHLMNDAESSFDELISAVKSKGGTTEAALTVFDETNIGVSTQKALKAAKERAADLSNLIADQIKK